MPWRNDAVPEDTRRLMEDVLDAAWEVYSTLGPGFLEGIYDACLAHELRLRGHAVTSEVWLPVEFKGLLLDRAQRADLIVDGRLIIEVKSAEELARVHRLQLVSYLKATGFDAGLLVSFNVPYFKKGFERVVHPKLLSRILGRSEGASLAAAPDQG